MDGFKEFKESKFWCQAVNEFMGSLLWVLVIGQTDNEWARGVTYVVLTSVLGGHFLPAWTMFRVLSEGMDWSKGLVWVVMQCLGAYVAGHLAGALGMTKLDQASFAMDDWKAGLVFFIALSLYIHIYEHINGDGYSGDLSKAFMTIFAMTAMHWFANDFIFNFAFILTDADPTQFWISMLWTIAAVVCVWLKLKMINQSDAPEEEYKPAQQVEDEEVA